LPFILGVGILIPWLVTYEKGHDISYTLHLARKGCLKFVKI
jgi:hypothetical protein